MLQVKEEGMLFQKAKNVIPCSLTSFISAKRSKGTRNNIMA